MWLQDYDPLHFWPLSTLAAALPLCTFFFVLLYVKKRVWKAALSGLLAAIIVALVVFRMPPLLIGVSAVLGILIGWLRIAWILIASIFLYNITLATGQFEVMKESFARLTRDRRIQVIVVTLCVGPFLEGTGSAGAPIAMVGVLLVGLGFQPLQAAKVCLLTNTVPLAWGGIGSPLKVLAAGSGLSESALSVTLGRTLPVVTAVLPLWLLCAMVGWRKAKKVLPIALASGLSYAAMQFCWSNLGGARSVDIVAASFSLIVTIVVLKFLPAQPAGSNGSSDWPYTGYDTSRKLSTIAILKAWSPFLLASACVFILGIPALRRALTFSLLAQPAPFLNNSVFRVPPAAPALTPEPAIADLNIFVMYGTALFIGATLSGILLGLSVKDAFRIFRQTVTRLVPALLGVSLMIGFLFVLRYSGMITIMGLLLTRTGPAFPFFSAFVGWIGVSLTGADVASSSLFSHVQSAVAAQKGLSPVLMAAAQAGGSVIGKMVDPQSILVSATATRQGGKEGEIFKTVFKHSLLLTCILGLVVLIYAYILPRVVPH